MTNKFEHMQLLADCGFVLFPLWKGSKGDGKEPAVASWQKSVHNPNIDKVLFPENYGIAIAAGQVVIDVDPRNGGDESWKKLQADTGLSLAKLCGYVVETGGGGGHFFFKLPAGVHMREVLKDYPGLELKKKGRFVVGAGSKNLLSGREYKVVRGSPLDITELPQAVIDIYRRDESLVLEEGSKGFMDDDETIELCRLRLADHPAAIQGERGDETTFQAAAICKELGLSPAKALDVMLEYNDRCSPPWDLEDLKVKIRSGYTNSQNALGSKNVKVIFNSGEGLVSEEETKQAEENTQNFINEIEKWAYSVATKTFFRTADMYEIDKEQFNDIFNGQTKKKKPSDFALSHGKLTKVASPTYWPGKGKFVFEDGKNKINTWVRSDLEAAEGDHAFFLEFVDYLLGENAWILNDYLAYMVQTPGVKLHWTPVIKSMPGIGKSLFGRMAENILGSHNVRRPTNAQLHEPYTAYMKNTQLVIVEELMASGRVALVNKLKDLITEPTIEVREMYRPTFKMPNRTNFLMLTNHEDALVLPNDDRRFAVVFSRARPRDQSYYAKLAEWISNNAAIMLNYYANVHQFNEKFEPQGRAPWTNDKNLVVNATRHPVEHTIMDLVSDEAFPMHGAIFDVSALMAALKTSHKGLNYALVESHCRNLGFHEIGRVEISEGAKPRLWICRNREMLESLPVEKLVRLYEKQEQQANARAGGVLFKEA